LILGAQCVVIGVEFLSRYIDRSDVNTAIYLSDGAGAAVLSRSDDPADGIISRPSIPIVRTLSRCACAAVVPAIHHRPRVGSRWIHGDEWHRHVEAGDYPPAA
jgi:hypothetical protein